MELLKGYPWPGNVRELRNILERALLLSRGQFLTVEHFSSLEYDQFLPDKTTANKLEDIEEEHIRTIIRRSAGDVRKAAGFLGISRATLYRKLKKFHKNP